uniref:FAD/NAD(P)-binding domain-containing protein n=1 Tax=Oryza barthii TaxID=65489 RepID=A0A0D3GWE0_9ORYZ
MQKIQRGEKKKTIQFSSQLDGHLLLSLSTPSPPLGLPQRPPRPSAAAKSHPTPSPLNYSTYKAAPPPPTRETAMTSALRRKAAEMASTAAAASSQGCISWALRQRGLGGGGARAVPVLPRRRFCVSAAAGAGFDNENREYVIVGGGNAAGYAARTFVEHGMADGRLCIVSKEAYPPYERPALTKGYLFPPDKKPARLPGFHTCVGSGGQRQTAEWYKENGIEVLYEDPVVAFDGKTHTLKTSSGKILKYGSLIISTGCEASRLPAKIGGNLPGVHYIRDVADADSLVSSLGKAKKIVVIGGGYIGMEVAAAACGWNLDTTIIFPEDHIMPRLFTPSLAKKYEELYQQNGVKFIKGALIDKLEAGSDGRVSSAVLEDGSVVEADTVIVGIGARPVIGPFEAVGVNTKVGGIEVDSLFRTSIPGIFAIGDVAAFPLKMYDRMTRVEHVDHARKSAHHCVEALLTSHTKPYDYLPYFYSRVFEYEGSSRKIWWQFYGDNGTLAKQLKWEALNQRLLPSGLTLEFSLLPQLAKSQPVVDKAKLKSATSVEDALEIARSSLHSGSSV